MSIDTEFLAAPRRRLPGRDIARTTTRSLHTTDLRPVKYGRGSGADRRLTNRCNMMCDPCFMDANQVGFRALS
jgi:hypothetical protein